MKRILCLLLCLPAFALGGCGGIYDSYRETERLTVVDTIGIDCIPGGIKLSFSSSAADGESDRFILTGAGDSIDSAIDQIQRRCTDQELFFRQIEYIIIGENAAKNSFSDIMAYICRSPLMRIDTPLYLVKGNEASILINDCRSDKAGISEVMAGIVRNARNRGDMQVNSASDVMSGLLSRGSALISALEIKPSSKSGESSTASVSGYGIIKDGKLEDYLSQEQALGVGFLTGSTGLCSVSVNDSRGSKAVLDITGGSLDVLPIWGKDGTLESVEINVKADAAAAEITGGGDMENPVYLRHLTGQLEAGISENISSVLRVSASLGADFAGLGARIEQRDAERYRLLQEPIAQLLPTLEFQVRVSGTLRHANDMDGNLQKKLR